MYLSDKPDEIEIHSIEQCTECGASLKDVTNERYIVCQVIDIPEIKVKIVEHRAEIKICPHCKHALCNAHILRELNGILELQKQEWANPMKYLLLEIKKEVDLSFNDFTSLPSHKIEKFERKYDEILKAGFEEDFAENIELYSQKTVKRSVSLNLLNRLSGYKNQILGFMYDFSIPFDNNLAERDLRMAKLKQKNSGTFRSSAGLIAFTRIRGYISTVRKQGKNALDCLISTFTATPVEAAFI